jgi:glycosyltransferase involved in cell wall biosynthesis
MKRLSIILPTYKVEPWIEKCIRSLEDQDIPKDDYEIIVVNDGTPDRSGDIARELSAEYKNIVVIDQENQGVSAARNTGIKAAKGNYLLFVDPDDTVEKNQFGEMLSFSEERGLDVAMFNQRIYTFDGKERIFNIRLEESKIIRGTELFEMRLSDSACKYLFNKDFLLKHRFFFNPEASFVEDGEFLARVLTFASKTAFKNLPFYNYYMREGSAVNSGKALSEEAIKGSFGSSVNLKSFRDNETLTSEQRIFLNQSVVKYVVMPFFIAANRKGFKKITQIKKALKRFEIGKLDTRGLKGMRLRHAILFNTSQNLLIFYLLGANFWRSIQIRLGIKKAR